MARLPFRLPSPGVRGRAPRDRLHRDRAGFPLACYAEGMPAPGPRVADGQIFIYRLFDVADSIDLSLAERMAAAPKSRLALDGEGTGTAFEFPRPPLHLVLGRRELRIGGEAYDAELTTHLIDTGVASILYKIAIPPGTTLGELLPLSAALIARPTPDIDAAARREAEALCRELAPALERPHEWEGLETYHVIFVRRFEEGEITADRLLAEAPIAELVLGETSGVPLSAAERQDVLSHNFTYQVDDLALVHWNGAFVYDSSGVEDIPDLLEFATAHLLELRYYDALLDRQLHAIYDEIAAGGSPVRNMITRKYRALERRVAGLLVEISEMIERLENAVKIVGDFYLARLYQGAVRRFRLPAWQETVLRKQRLLNEVNELIGHAADTSRMELLEIIIILLIAFEVVRAILK